MAKDDEAHFIRETLQGKVMTKLGEGRGVGDRRNRADVILVQSLSTSSLAPEGRPSRCRSRPVVASARSGKLSPEETRGEA